MLAWCGVKWVGKYTNQISISEIGQSLVCLLADRIWVIKFNMQNYGEVFCYRKLNY